MKKGVSQMAGKREALLAEAIKDSTAIFTSEDIQTVAGIDGGEVTELIGRVSSNTDEIIGEFLRKKSKSQ